MREQARRRAASVFHAFEAVGFAASQPLLNGTMASDQNELFKFC